MPPQCTDTSSRSVWEVGTKLYHYKELLGRKAEHKRIKRKERIYARKHEKHKSAMS